MDINTTSRTQLWIIKNLDAMVKIGNSGSQNKSNTIKKKTIQHGKLQKQTNVTLLISSCRSFWLCTEHCTCITPCLRIDYLNMFMHTAWLTKSIMSKCTLLSIASIVHVFLLHQLHLPLSHTDCTCLSLAPIVQACFSHPYHFEIPP